MVKYSGPFLLSSAGSTRATAYGFSNKSLTLGGSTHVVWLDAVSQVCARSYGHRSGQWGETHRLFTGCDNHASPALSADAGGHLRLVFGPHGWWGEWNQGRFNWTISARPGRLDRWREPQSFGCNATYPSLVHTARGLDAVAYRGGEEPPSVMFQRQRGQGGWTKARELMRQDIPPQYTHVGATAACGRDGVLYVAAHFYNVGGDYNGPPERKRSSGVAVLRTADLGDTWTDLSGEPVAVPTLYDARIAVPPVGEDVRTGGLTVDSSGAPWALTLSEATRGESLLLSRWSGRHWETTDLAPALPEGRTAVDAVLTIDTADRLHVAATALRPETVAGETPDAAWGHPSCEVFHMVSEAGGGTFECNMISTPDEELASWLPNISLAGIHHPVEKPVILYTHGEPGEGCSPLTETEVYCVMIEEVH